MVAMAVSQTNVQCEVNRRVLMRAQDAMSSEMH
jgi:hypothetical protein